MVYRWNDYIYKFIKMLFRFIIKFNLQKEPKNYYLPRINFIL